MVAGYVIIPPRVSTQTAYSDWLPAMNGRLRLDPPKQTLAMISRVRITPMRAPSAANTGTPTQTSPTQAKSGPIALMLPNPAWVERGDGFGREVPALRSGVGYRCPTKRRTR